MIDYPDDPRATAACSWRIFPALIEGASENRGLGHRFLRHIERCSPAPAHRRHGRPDGAIRGKTTGTFCASWSSTTRRLLEKPRLVAANKMDLPEAKPNLATFKRRYKVPVLLISCLTRNGLDKLGRDLLRQVENPKKARKG